MRIETAITFILLMKLLDVALNITWEKSFATGGIFSRLTVPRSGEALFDWWDTARLNCGIKRCLPSFRKRHELARVICR